MAFITYNSQYAIKLNLTKPKKIMVSRTYSFLITIICLPLPIVIRSQLFIFNNNTFHVVIYLQKIKEDILSQGLHWKFTCYRSINWTCILCRLNLYWGVRANPTECLKQHLMLRLTILDRWRMWGTPSMPLHTGSIWHRLVITC